MTAFVNLFPQLPLSAATNLNDSRSLLWRRRSCVQRNGSFSRGVWRAQLHATTLPKSSNNGSLVKDQSAIRLIACDMDGTLLNEHTRISDENVNAVNCVLTETDIKFIPATGKSRAGALKAMGSLGLRLRCMYPNGCPGVYLQGLIVFGESGEVIYENSCDDKLASVVATLADELDLDLLAYSRDSILCEKRSHFIDLLPTYQEPTPEEIGSWHSVIGTRPLNKFIFMAEPSHIDAVRPIIAERIQDAGCLTQAQPNMLEVLPPLSSKGDGVSRLLKHFDILPGNVMAIGDAENDLELLKMVGYSCAVANALPSVKAAAKYTDFKTNNEHGVAEVLDRFVLSKMNVRL